MNKNPFETDYKDFPLQGKPSISPLLNILTILTIIGSIILMMLELRNYFYVEKDFESIQKMVSSKVDQTDLPLFLRSFLPNQDTLDLIEKLKVNKLPLAVAGIMGCLLCLFGAIEMRKLKKQGFAFWLFGTFLPFVVVVFLVGLEAYSGIYSIGLIFPALFLLLYTTRRGELVN